MQTLDEIGVSKKAARVWFKLNKDTEVAVKTAKGVSDTATVGDCIGQEQLVGPWYHRLILIMG